MTDPRQALIEVLKGVALDDLPDAEFYCDANMIIARLAGEGYVIGEAAGQQIQLSHNMLIEPLRFDAGTYRIQRVACDPDAIDDFAKHLTDVNRRRRKEQERRRKLGLNGA